MTDEKTILIFDDGHRAFSLVIPHDSAKPAALVVDDSFVGESFNIEVGGDVELRGLAELFTAGLEKILEIDKKGRQQA